MAETVITPISGSSSSPLPAATTTTTTSSGPAQEEYPIDQKWLALYPWLYIDPDQGSGEIECDDTIAKFMAKFTGAGGTWSNWTERHATIYGYFIGYYYVKSSADIPAIPKWCSHDPAYFLFGIAMGRAAAKNGGLNETIASLDSVTGLLKNGKVLALITGALAAGGIALPVVIQKIIALFAGA